MNFLVQTDENHEPLDFGKKRKKKDKKEKVRMLMLLLLSLLVSVTGFWAGNE